MNLINWLRLWAGLFVLAAVPKDPPADDPPADDPPAGVQDELDLAGTDDEPPPQDEPDDDDPVALKAARDKATKEAGEHKAAAERHRLEAEDLRRRVPLPVVPPTEEAKRLDAEDRELADPKLDANRRWQIGANRTLRETKSRTDATLAQAQDLSDKANFELSCGTNKRFAAVKGEVEEELRKARAMGQNLPR